MNKKLYVLGGLTIMAIVLIGWLAVRGLSESNVVANNKAVDDSTIKAQATQSLKDTLNIANQLYGITEGAAFGYKPLNDYGTSGNFGVYKGSTGERLIEEKFVQFEDVNNTAEQGTNYSAVVDSKTNKVVSFVRKPHYGFCKEGQSSPCGNVMDQAKLGQLVQQFLEQVEPEFKKLTSNLAQYRVEKKAGQGGDNYFFRWEDGGFKDKLPVGVEIDNSPMIQVGITSTGFIFSYDNTMSLYQDALKQLATE